MSKKSNVTPEEKLQQPVFTEVTWFVILILNAIQFTHFCDLKSKTCVQNMTDTYWAAVYEKIMKT